MSSHVHRCVRRRLPPFVVKGHRSYEHSVHVGIRFRRLVARIDVVALVSARCWSYVPAVSWLVAGLWGLCGGFLIELVDLYKLIRVDGRYRWPARGSSFWKAYGAAVVIRLLLGFIAAFALQQGGGVGNAVTALGVGAGATGFLEHLGRPARGAT